MRDKKLSQGRKLENIVCLKDITVKIPKGSFVCVVGKIGCGKTSLIQAMLGEMLPISDEIINSYKGKGDMSKELTSDEIISLQEDLLNNYAKNGHEIEVNGTCSYTQQ